MIDGQSVPTFMMVGNAARSAATSVAALPNKSIAVVNEAGTIQTAAISAGNKYRIVAKDSNGNVVYSPTFSSGGLIYKSYQAYAAPTQQVTVVGYNPATTLGTLDAVADMDYELTLDLQSTFGIYNNTPILKQVSYRTPTGVATQEQVATGIMVAWNAIMLNETTPFAKVDRVSNGTATALVADATVTNGSTSVACTAHALTAGTYVGLAGATYKIVSVTTNAFELDQPYQGASGTVTKGTTYATQGCSLATVSNWGIRITGLPFAYSNPQTQDYYRTSFFTRFTKPSLGVATDTGSPIVNVATPYEGSGTGFQVAEMEYRMNFATRDITVSSFPTTKIKQEAVISSNYDLFIIKNVENNFYIPTAGEQINSVTQTILAVDTTLTTDISSLKTVLGIS